MPMRVRKRDGREVPFDARKIDAAIAKALAAVGEDDPGLASELAGVVALTLEQRHDAPAAEGRAQASVPEIEEIQDLVERALIEVGRASVAKAYILYRDRRARAREALSVHESGDPGTADSALRRSRARVEVEHAERASPWSKARIVAALINEAELTREVAERVASRVEERVFAAGLRRISTNLIREMVDNELVTLGLSTALRRQLSFGVPAYDLRGMFNASEPPLDPARAAAGEALVERDTSERIASEVLRRFALHEVFSESTARLHLAGDLHVVDVARPHQVLTCSVPAHLLSAGAANVNSAFERIGELAAIASETAHGVVLDEPAGLLQPLARDSKTSSMLGAWLRALESAAQGCSRRIDLASPSGGARASSLTQRVIEELAAMRPSAHQPRLYLDEGELEQLLGDRSHGAELEAQVEQLLAAERLIVTWGDRDQRCAAPGCHRFAGERALVSCGGAVAINLPRLALRAGPWREDRMLELLSSTVASAVDALAELCNFQQRVRTARPADARGRTGYCITPVGVREALTWLGDGEVRAEQGARLLGYLAESVQRAGDARHMSIVLAPFFGDRARVRFARLDAELPQHAQRLLYDEGVGSRAAAGAPYSSGYRLSPAPGLMPWDAEAEMLSTVAVGALHPLPDDSAHDGRTSPSTSLAAAWRRFAQMRRQPWSAHVERDLPAPARPRESPLFDEPLHTLEPMRSGAPVRSVHPEGTRGSPKPLAR